MATAYKVLGQSAPMATTNTSLYTVPAATQTVFSTITVCNRGATAGTFRVAVRPAAATLANQHYIAYDLAAAANSVTALTLGITANASDVVTVYASSSDFTFQAFGSEIS